MNFCVVSVYPVCLLIFAQFFYQNEAPNHLLMGEPTPLFTQISVQPSPKEPSLVLHTEPSKISLSSPPPQLRENQAFQTLLNNPHLSGDISSPELDRE